MSDLPSSSPSSSAAASPSVVRSKKRDKEKEEEKDKETQEDEIENVTEKLAEVVISKTKEKDEEKKERTTKVFKGFRESISAASDGESESEDADYVWRALTAKDLIDLHEKNTLEAGQPKDDLRKAIKVHVEEGSDKNHHCPLLSASRSKKQAARYACYNPGGGRPTFMIAKIRVDNIAHLDLTIKENLDAIGLEPSGRVWAENSQEVIIYENIPKEQVELFHVQLFYKKKGYGEAKQQSTKKSNYVALRTSERSYHHGYAITPMEG